MRMKRENSYTDQKGIYFESTKNIKIQPLRKMSDLSRELSKKLRKRVTVVDIIEESITNDDRCTSLLTGKFHDYDLSEYDKPGFGLIIVNKKKSLNKKKGLWDVYNTLFVFRET